VNTRKICFILNPKAGAGLNDQITSLVKRHFSPPEYEIEILFTDYVKHAAELSREAVAKNMDIVVAVGGDGTINEAAEPLVNSETVLAIIPTGSGNGFARHFNIPLKIEKAIEVIKKGNIKIVDSLLINGKFCMNIAGSGFDAYIAHLFAGYGKRGFISYAKLVTKEYFSYHEKKYTIQYDNKTLSRNAFLISLANGSQFGNGARIAPLAIPDDGLIDLTILKKIPIHKLFFTLRKLFNGTLEQSKHVEIIRSKSFHILSEEEIETHLDGEPEEARKEIIAEVVPLSVKLIIP
jgi:diacylglycerol kinase (ATP)